MFLLQTYLMLAAAAAAPAPLSTVAETSGYLRTGRYAEVETLCTQYPKRFSGKVRCDSFGVTPEGRRMLAFIASADGVLTPELAQKKRRPVVMIQGGIHAGEIDGKDAGFWLLRDLLEGTVAKGALRAVTLVFVPVFNVDGHERFGAHQRPNQIGPEEMGWRVTGQNLNLNRDYAKADAPEMQAMLGLLGRWEPIIYVDLHVTDGAKFQHDIALVLAPVLAGPPALTALGRPLNDQLLARMKSQGHLPLDFYPSFIKEDEPLSGFEVGVPPPRLSHGYWQLKNRFSLLIETHSWKPYRERVKATYDACVAVLERATADASAWLQAAQAVDRADLQRGGTPVALGWEPTEHQRTIDFLGYAFTAQDSAVSGKKWLVYDEKVPQVWQVPFHDELKVSRSAVAPKGGYLVLPAHAAAVQARLALHGFQSRRLEAPMFEASVQVFRATATKFRTAPYEGRQSVALTGEWQPERRDVPTGTLFVPIAQPHLPLLMNLLEPTAPDSFAAWGFFNAHFEQKEYMEDYVAEEVARAMLVDPQVKAAFEGRLKADPEFAKSPKARLDFFYARHPSYDERFNLVPVFRVDELPAPVR